jgi:hypothetical protein
MASQLRRKLAAAYGVIVVAMLLFFAVLAFGHAWGERTHSGTNAVISSLFALFFLYAAAVLIFEAIKNRQYQRALDALGFVPFDWKEAQILQVVASQFATDRKAFLSRGFRGNIHGSDVYVFNYGRDTAWWAKRGTAAILMRPSESAIMERAKALLLEQADADLTIHTDWFVVRARGRVSPDGFADWVTAVVDSLRSA